MALPQIETGYKPEGALGALYQGFNAANADQMSQLDLIKQFLANQREQQMQPLDVNIRGMESDRATQARSPEMLQAYKDLYLGQRDTTKAAGDKARELSTLDIATGKQDFQHKQAVGNLLAKLDVMKAGGDSGGQIGFQMQPPTQPQSSGGFNWQVSPQEQQARDQVSLGLMQQEQQQFPNDPNLAKDIVNRQKSLASPVQPTNTNNSPLVPQPPIRNGGITQGSPEYERVMQALVDQPELRTALIKGDQKLDSVEFNKMMDLMMRERLAEAKASRGSENKDTAEQAAVRKLKEQLASGEIDGPTYEAAIASIINKKFAKPEQQGIKPVMTPEGGISLSDKAPTPQYIPPSQAKPALPSGWTMK